MFKFTNSLLYTIKQIPSITTIIIDPSKLLNLDKNFKCADIDIAYSKIENKTNEVKLAWKILRDEYYSEIYKK